MEISITCELCRIHGFPYLKESELCEYEARSRESNPGEKLKKCPHFESAVIELAQKLYNEDGYSGNLYKSDKDQVYESRAIDILEGNNDKATGYFGLRKGEGKI